MRGLIVTYHDSETRRARASTLALARALRQARMEGE
jgi:hypothetical protein